MHLRQSPQIGPGTIALSYRASVAGEPMLAHMAAPMIEEPETEYDEYESLFEALADRLNNIETKVDAIHERLTRPNWIIRWSKAIWRNILSVKSRLLAAARRSS